MCNRALEVPSIRYMHHLAALGRHVSPKSAWCYMSEDLMISWQKEAAEAQDQGLLAMKVPSKYFVGKIALS